MNYPCNRNSFKGISDGYTGLKLVGMGNFLFLLVGPGKLQLPTMHRGGEKGSFSIQTQCGGLLELTVFMDWKELLPWLEWSCLS
ncbi:hypothetical protein SUGI_0049260 [Cryptomeria japonica]|nr:hypothetical protein SUGI_0049260 [Cryptomeria japonica]